MQELRNKKPKPKHRLYNSILNLCRKAEIPVETLNGTTIIGKGLLNGLWFRPSGNYCKIFVQNKPYSFDLHCSYNVEILTLKLYQKKLISAGTYLFLSELEAVAA